MTDDTRDQQPPFSREPPGHSQGSKNATLNRRLIAERISTLLSHYWTADESAALRDAQLGDWLEDLNAFAASVVAQAVAHWRQHETRRPTPADIRKICDEFSSRRAAVPAGRPPRLPRPGEISFPSRAHRAMIGQTFEKGGAKALSVEETWFLHAYWYALRRVVFSAEDATAPFDVDRIWLDPGLVDAAEAFYRGLSGQPGAERPGGRPADHVVREDFEQLRVGQWSGAELAIVMARRDDEADGAELGRGREARSQLAVRKLGGMHARNQAAFGAHAGIAPGQSLAEEITP